MYLEILYFIGFILVIVLVWLLKKAITDEKAHREFVRNPFAGAVGFHPDRTIFSHLKVFGVDVQGQKIGFRDRTGKITIIPFQDITNCMLYINEDVMYETSTIGTLGGAVLGGAAAGRAGAVVGGLLGGGTLRNGLRYLCVAVYTKDLLHPVYKHECVDYDDSLSDIPFPGMDLQTAHEIVAIIRNIIESQNAVRG